MNKTKGALTQGVFIVSIIGLLWGVMLQISFEPTDQSLAEAKVGKILMTISIVAFLFALVLVRTKHKNK